MWLWMALVGCQEYQLYEPPVVPPAQPPAAADDGLGGPPDWQDCTQGFLGRYSNLTVDHPDVEPGEDPMPPAELEALDWWDTVAFTRYDASLDFGQGWWPVDEGLIDDPAYFSAHWVAWLRAWDDTEIEFILGSQDDSWVILDETELASIPGVHDYAQGTFVVNIDSGQYPLQVFYAHRAAESGLRFRVLSGDVSLCYPDFTDG